MLVLDRTQSACECKKKLQLLCTLQEGWHFVKSERQTTKFDYETLLAGHLCGTHLSKREPGGLHIQCPGMELQIVVVLVNFGKRQALGQARMESGQGADSGIHKFSHLSIRVANEQKSFKNVWQKAAEPTYLADCLLSMLLLLLLLLLFGAQIFTHTHTHRHTFKLIYIFSFTENRCNQPTLAAVYAALPVRHIDKCEHYTLVSGPHPAHLRRLLCHPEVLQVLGPVSDVFSHIFPCNADKATYIILELTVTNMPYATPQAGAQHYLQVGKLLIFLQHSHLWLGENCLEKLFKQPVECMLAVNVLLPKVFWPKAV